MFGQLAARLSTRGGQYFIKVLQFATRLEHGALYSKCVMNEINGLPKALCVHMLTCVCAYVPNALPAEAVITL